MIVRHPTGLSHVHSQWRNPAQSIFAAGLPFWPAAVVGALPLRHYPAQIEPEET